MLSKVFKCAFLAWAFIAMLETAPCYAQKRSKLSEEEAAEIATEAWKQFGNAYTPPKC